MSAKQRQINVENKYNSKNYMSQKVVDARRTELTKNGVNSRRFTARVVVPSDVVLPLSTVRLKDDAVLLVLLLIRLI